MAIVAIANALLLLALLSLLLPHDGMIPWLLVVFLCIVLSIFFMNKF